MKQGRTEKVVFAKLSTEKVELSMFDDLNKLSEKADQMFNKAYNETFDAIDRANKIALTSQKPLRALYQQINSDKESLERKAYELGFGSSEVKALLGKVDKELARLDKRTEKLESVSRTLNSLI
tara:strand:- start:270 stop:641 length:372 start_codon:yes stop_codon:yes gene_type:complete